MPDPAALFRLDRRLLSGVLRRRRRVGRRGERPQFSPGWNIYPATLNSDSYTDLFLYNPSTGASWVEFANGKGGWSGVKGPQFFPGWTVYTGQFG